MSHVTGSDDNPGSDSGSPLQQERILNKAIGRRPILTVKVGGVAMKCLLDTGSQVTTVTEKFFESHLRSLVKDVANSHSCKWFADPVQWLHRAGHGD